MKRKYFTMKLNSEFNFGKYKNRKVSEIFEKDPEYLKWVFFNVKIPIRFSNETIEEYKKLGITLNQRKHPYCIR